MKALLGQESRNYPENLSRSAAVRESLLHEGGLWQLGRVYCIWVGGWAVAVMESLLYEGGLWQLGRVYCMRWVSGS